MSLQLLALCYWEACGYCCWISCVDIVLSCVCLYRVIFFGPFPVSDAQSMPKDEEYEKGCVRGNMVYKIHWTDPPTLMPVESMCGHIPQVAILDTKEVIW